MTLTQRVFLVALVWSGAVVILALLASPDFTAAERKRLSPPDTTPGWCPPDLAVVIEDARTGELVCADAGIELAVPAVQR